MGVNSVDTMRAELGSSLRCSNFLPKLTRVAKKIHSAITISYIDKIWCDPLKMQVSVPECYNSG